MGLLRQVAVGPAVRHVCGARHRGAWPAPHHSSRTTWSSARVRDTFIDFFQDRGHQHIRSSPVIPWNDPTLAFVNAGMNQFKPVLLGQAAAPCPRATNAQKCVRVGGKHNDLADVGRDTYHHTFFEMLGNWSFGDYFKREACEMAWCLLTDVYKLPKENLYVTYFGGDEKAGLEPDLESKDIWRSIGVGEARVLPFGMRDNFWEMGSHGPCGPCTEIHFDRHARPDAAARVNLGVEDVIELWNLVFIQYERQVCGRLQALGTQHVDTGMGLERVTAVLNGKASNYDTDLFTPLFSAIQKMSGRAGYGGGFSADGSCADTAYRILADHARMFTVALADGMFPEDSHKLRRIIRKAANIGEQSFGFATGSGRLAQLAQVVAGSLESAYPEIHDQLPRVQTILTHEEHLFADIKDNINKEWKGILTERPELSVLSEVHMAGVIDGVREVLPHVPDWRARGATMPGPAALKLYDTYGLHIDQIEEIAEIYGLTVDQQGFNQGLEEIRKLTKLASMKDSLSGSSGNTEHILEYLVSQGVPATNDTAKYTYTVHSEGHYSFPPLSTAVLAVWEDGALTDASTGEQVGLVLADTNFYQEAGGQVSDTGMVANENFAVEIFEATKIGDYVIHWGSVRRGEVRVGAEVESSIGAEGRVACMQHHTATHLLNAAVKHVTGLSCQRSSLVAADHLSLSVRTYQALDETCLAAVQHVVKEWIGADAAVRRDSLGIGEVVRLPGVTLVPGEIYPDLVHVLTTELRRDDGSVVTSVEPCCGTHVHTTGAIHNFVITAVKSAGIGVRNIRGVCGREADIAEANAATLLRRLEEWQEEVAAAVSAGDLHRVRAAGAGVASWRREAEGRVLPHLARLTVTATLDALARTCRNAQRGDATKHMVDEMAGVYLSQPSGPIVHLLATNFGKSKAVLSKATRGAGGRPVLVLAVAEGAVVARAIMPEGVVGGDAMEWLRCVSAEVGGKVAAPKGQDPARVCNFRSKPVHANNLQLVLDAAIQRSKEYISQVWPNGNS